MVVESESTLHLEEFSILPVPFKRDAKYLAILKSLGMQDFLNEFNAALKKGQETGVFDKIINSYY